MAGTSATLTGVQSTSTAVREMPTTVAGGTILPSRCGANSAAAACTSTGIGRTSMMSASPLRIAQPRRSTWPSAPSAIANDDAAVPYRNAVSPNPKPASRPVLVNTIPMAARSRVMAASSAAVSSTNDVRYCQEQRKATATRNR
jgi:hypothetical protein